MLFIYILRFFHSFLIHLQFYSYFLIAICLSFSGNLLWAFPLHVFTYDFHRYRKAAATFFHLLSGLNSLLKSRWREEKRTKNDIEERRGKRRKTFELCNFFLNSLKFCSDGSKFFLELHFLLTYWYPPQKNARGLLRAHIVAEFESAVSYSGYDCFVYI